MRGITRQEVREDDEGATAMSSNLAQHLNQNLNELRIDGGKMSYALLNGER